MHYLKAFQEASAKAGKDFRLIGNCLFVEKMPVKERKTKSGILYPQLGGDASRNIKSMTADYSEFVRILMCGEGYYDPETKETMPLEVKVGDVVLVSQQAVRWFTVFGDLADADHIEKIGITQEDQIMAKGAGEAGYELFFDCLRSHL